MRKLLNSLRMKSERGDATIVTTLLVVPILFFLILTMIDVSYYFQARSAVQSVTRDAARQVAIYGGNNNKALNPNGNKTVAKVALEKLYSGGKCTQSGCNSAPVVTCTPTTTTQAGQEVSCTTRYSYKTINPANPITKMFGFTSDTIVVKEYAKAETGF